jgi:hypothetical protein
MAHLFTTPTNPTGRAEFDVTLLGAAADDFVAATATSLQFQGPRVVPNCSEISEPRGAPRVQATFVGGTNWARAFYAELAEENLGDADLGFEVPAGPSGQTPLPWSNANRIAVRFAAVDQSVVAADLSLGSAAGVDYEFASFTYDPIIKLAVWTLDVPLAAFSATNRRAADRVTLSLSGFDFSRALNVSPGDATREGDVTVADYAVVRSAFGRTADDEGSHPRHYTVFRDINASGTASAVDLGIVRGNLGASLSALPPPPAGPSSGTPPRKVTAELLDE